MNNGDCESREFEVKVGIHQGSVLNLLLFIIVLEALSKEFREGLPWELLYADDLALIAESEEKLVEKIKCWKEGMLEKGLRVNMGNGHVAFVVKVLEATQFVVVNAKSGFTRSVV